ncbi:MAG: PQQ-binding-like beta-propeller repeat protein [candidate division Zixibacteria bacterium]|nr:PQQ-binding-like beta-propeller repeat protein [candidate division Zixibacteria bacterium]
MLLNKKLIIAVLTLGLLLTLGGAAFSDDGNKRSTASTMDRYETFNPNAPRVNDIGTRQATRQIEAFNRPMPACALATPMTVLPPDYYCTFIDPSGGSSAYYWTLPDPDYPIDLYLQKVAPDEGYNCSLLTVCIGVLANYTTGSPDMWVLLYDESLVPIDSVLVPNSQLPASGAGYVCADFSTLNGGGPYVFSDGEPFWIGLGVAQNDIGDTLAFLSSGVVDDDVIYTFLMGGSWYNWTAPLYFLFAADVCYGRIPYSECYRQEYDQGLGYYWDQPNAYGDDYFSMRFTVNGPETLMAVGVAMFSNPAYFEPVGTPDLDVFVWGDDGFGFPDTTDVIFQTTIPFASLVFYPDYNHIDLSTLNIVLNGRDFHVGWSTNDITGGVLAGCSDDGAEGTGRSTVLTTSGWGSVLNVWGVDANMKIYADLCRDEFSECRNISYYGGPSAVFYAPDRYGDVAFAVRSTPFGEGCRLEKFWFVTHYPGTQVDPPWNHYSENAQAQVYDADPADDNLPGDLLGTIDIAPGDLYIAPGYYTWNSANFSDQNIRFDGDIWTGIESFATDTLNSYVFLHDAWDSNPQRRSANFWGIWAYIEDDWGADANIMMDIDVCCVPIPEIACAQGEDWPTYAVNFARTNHSLNSIGDARCNLTKTWEATLGAAMSYASPLIYKDTVVGIWLDRVVALDVNTGTTYWQRVAGDYGGFVLASGMIGTPTIYNFDDYGVNETYVFVGGGGARAMTAFDLATGDTVWSRGFFVHGTNTFSYSITVILDIEGVPYLYYASDDGDLYAVNALTGAQLWTVNVGGNISRGICTDGELLYVGRDQNVTYGDVLAINPATGATVWSLYDVNGGLLGGTVVPAKDYPGNERFTGGISYDALTDQIFAPGYYDHADASSPVQDGGVIYALNAGNGVANWINLCNGDGDGQAAPAIDASNVITIGWNPWLDSGQRRGPIAFNKLTGDEVWANTTEQPGIFEAGGLSDGGVNTTANYNYHMDGAFSCETEAADIYFALSKENFLNFFNADNGEQIMHRRFETVYYGHRWQPIIGDGHVLVNHRNLLVCLTNQVDRPRLSINGYNLTVPVEFGGTASENITYEGVLENQGCAPLTITNIYIDEESNGTIPEDIIACAVNPDLTNNMQAKIDKMSSKVPHLMSSVSDLAEITMDNMRLSRNLATYAPPSWFNYVVSPTPGAVINPGSPAVDIVLNIDASQITRGVHTFYAYIESDDPDYFLNHAYMDNPSDFGIPEIKLNIQGGCLMDHTIIEFGDITGGNENSARIFNTGKLADKDMKGNLLIDGDDESVWQGGVIFGISKYRMAWHSGNWEGETWEWRSLLPDILCGTEGECEMQHEVNALLGYMSTDNGASYDPVYGEVVTYSFVDSVSNFYDTLTDPNKWNWIFESDNGFAPPYDDTLTMGFKVCAKAIGAYDVPELENFVIYRYAMSSRYGASYPGLYVGFFMDYDVLPNNKANVVGYDADHSVAFCYDCLTGDRGFGVVKVPFGGCYEPLLNARTLTARQAMWNDSSIWLDSVYAWMTQYDYQLVHQPGIIPCNADADDRDAFITFGNYPLNADAEDSTIIAYAQFAELGMTDPSDPANYFDLANMINKWCGFGRGDVNNDGAINLVDIIYLANYINGGDGPFPFEYLGDVNNDGDIDNLDVTYLIAFYFNGGPDPLGGWTL